MEGQSTNLNRYYKLIKESEMAFDYEVNRIKFEENEIPIYFLEDDTENKNYEISEDDNKGNKKVYKNANCFKRLVSKKKRRFRNEHFDLDLSYITKRIIAMGFPSVRMESYWRNDADDVKSFLKMYHNEVKVYNLCLENNRIYSKERFSEYKLGFFPFTDHEPCPVKLMLEFCVDICLYFIKNPYAIAAIHCKAGKGRTGIMCISYLIFTGLFKNSDEAINYYGLMRTTNKKVKIFLITF